MLREMGLALAAHTCQALVLVTVILMALYEVDRPGLLAEPRAWLMAAVCWATAVLLFGCNTWAMRVRSTRAWWITTLLGFYLGMIVVGVAMFCIQIGHVVPLYGIAVGTLIAGLMLTYAAYRRWLVTDVE